MEIYYQGTDITDLVQIRKCNVRDAAGGRCDSLEIEFENAARWYAWGPEEDDQIVVAHNGYNSGILYVNTILPEDGKYRILATALPCGARTRENKSFCQKTIEEIMRSCAMSSGMDFQIFGIDGKSVIPYAERENESCASFLNRLLMWEGASLKCVNGMYTAIGISYAQGLTAHQTIELDSRQTGVRYTRQGTTYKALTITTPYAEATAEDTAVSSTHMRKRISGIIPALNNIQAGRWARGTLLHLNRICECLYMQTEYNPGLTAMARMDVMGSTDAVGEWMIEEVEHDLYNLKSTVRMHRCIRTIQ